MSKNTTSKLTSQSPWARPADDTERRLVPLSKTELNEQKALWIREETAKLVEFVDNARHHALQNAVAIENQFPNKMAHISYMHAVAMHYDFIEHGIMVLAAGGKTPEALLSEFIDTTEIDDDLRDFFAEDLAELSELERAKNDARGHDSFKIAFIDQIMHFIDMGQSFLEYTETNDAGSLEANEQIITALALRGQSGLDTSYPFKERLSVAHWPMASRLQDAITVLHRLYLQADAALTAMNTTYAHDIDNNAQLYATYMFTEAVSEMTFMLVNNLTQGIQGDIYFYDFYDLQEFYGLNYGDAAHDPDTPWTPDENQLLQLKINKLADLLIMDLKSDNPYTDTPLFLNVVAQVAEHIKSVFEEKFPVAEDKKPDFVKDHEAYVMDNFLQEGDELDTMKFSDSKTSTASNASKAAVHATPRP